MIHIRKPKCTSHSYLFAFYNYISPYVFNTLRTVVHDNPPLLALTEFHIHSNMPRLEAFDPREAVMILARIKAAQKQKPWQSKVPSPLQGSFPRSRTQSRGWWDRDTTYEGQEILTSYSFAYLDWFKYSFSLCSTNLLILLMPRQEGGQTCLKVGSNVSYHQPQVSFCSLCDWATTCGFTSTVHTFDSLCHMS